MRLSLSRRNVAWAATDTTDPAAPRFQACRMQAPAFHPSLASHCRGSAQSLVSIGQPQSSPHACGTHQVCPMDESWHAETPMNRMVVMTGPHPSPPEGTSRQLSPIDNLTDDKSMASVPDRFVTEEVDIAQHDDAELFGLSVFTHFVPYHHLVDLLPVSHHASFTRDVAW